MDTVKFECGGCGREIQAPAGGAGKTGKCPFCGYGNVVPNPAVAEDDDAIPLAPIDPAEEERMQHEVDALMEAERLLRSDDEPGGEQAPLEHRDDLNGADLRHFVINYCLDMAGSNLERAQFHAEKLKTFGDIGMEAVDDFLLDEIPEPALKDIPPAVLRGFLKQLRSELG